MRLEPCSNQVSRRRTLRKLCGVWALIVTTMTLPSVSQADYTYGPVDLGNLPDYLFVFTDGGSDANWQGATKGFVGDVAVDGLMASERTSGTVPYAGIISTNDVGLGKWQPIVSGNTSQASSLPLQTAQLAGLQTDLTNAFSQANALSATPGFTSVSSTSLNGLDVTNNPNKVFVINITSGLSVSSQINITGNADDIFILRWSTSTNYSNGYQGEVKFQSGGGIVPHGGLGPSNFVNFAGDIGSSGGGSNPPAPYPQGPRLDNGQGPLIVGGSNFNGGGFFADHWPATGDPITHETSSGVGETGSLSNAIFVGGWYSSTVKFSMTSGTSGVYIAPIPVSVVPEPTSIVLTAIGGLCLVAWRCLRRSA